MGVGAAYAAAVTVQLLLMLLLLMEWPEIIFIKHFFIFTSNVVLSPKFIYNYIVSFDNNHLTQLNILKRSKEQLFHSKIKNIHVLASKSDLRNFLGKIVWEP